MKIAVYAKTGTIPQYRWVRLTGATNKDGAYEVEPVGATRRAHAIILDHPAGGISPTTHGYAETLGPLVMAEASSAIVADGEASPNADGTVSSAKRGDSTVAVCIGGATKGARTVIMMRWGRQR